MYRTWCLCWCFLSLQLLCFYPYCDHSICLSYLVLIFFISIFSSYIIFLQKCMGWRGLRGFILSMPTTLFFLNNNRKLTSQVLTISCSLSPLTPGLPVSIHSQPPHPGQRAHGGLGLQHAPPLSRHRELAHRSRGVQTEGVLQEHGRVAHGQGGFTLHITQWNDTSDCRLADGPVIWCQRASSGGSSSRSRLSQLQHRMSPQLSSRHAAVCVSSSCSLKRVVMIRQCGFETEV